LATNVTKENVGQFSPKMPWATKGDKVKAAKLQRAQERADRREARRLAREAKADKRLMDRTAKQQLKEATIKRGRVRPAEEEPEEEEQDELSLEIFPVIYNGYMAIEASPSTEGEERTMKRLGFSTFGNYAFLQIKDQASFHATFDWLDKKFYMPSQNRNRLVDLMDSFASGKGRKFNIELAPISQFKNFYIVAHKLSKINPEYNVPELKVYPVIINGNLFLNIDLSTNPAFKKYLGKVIPKTRGYKFQQADGLWIQFFKTATEVLTWLKTKGSAVDINNLSEFKTEFTDLKEKLKYIQKLAKG
jgi:hypothetical protein